MFLLLAFICAVIGLLLWQGDISDIPFSQLTPKMVFSNLFAVGLFCGALYYSFKSLAEDRIWPWRWRLTKFAKKWLSRTYAVRDIKSKIKKRQRLGYDTAKLEQELKELLQPHDNEKEYEKERRRNLGYKDDK